MPATQALLLSCAGLLAIASASYDSDVKSILAEVGVSKMQTIEKLRHRFQEEYGWMKQADFPTIWNNPAPCVNGVASVDGVDDYPCDSVDFLGAVGMVDLRITREDFTDSIFEMADIWGWLSPNGREITIAGMTNAVWFIDSTNPLEPKHLGYIESPRDEGYWSDIKVYQNVAYIVQDKFSSSPALEDRGMQVFDLTRLEADEVLDSEEPVKFEPDLLYSGHGATHNTVINTETGYLYNVGIELGGANDCGEGMHMLDLNQDPLNPVFVGCAAEAGYVHDAQCVVYSGPDATYSGREICFGYNEDSLVIYDVTDKNNVAIVSQTGYEGATYTHQGWLNADQDFLLLNDELDEANSVVSFTRTFVVNVTSLESPVFAGHYDHPVAAIDHNLYFWGDMHAKGYAGSPAMDSPPSSDYAYCTNYASGVRILNTNGMKLSPPVITQAAYFDTSPTLEGLEWYGTWSSYMHPSGVIAVTVIESGVFFLNFTEAFVDPQDTGAPTISGEGTDEEEDGSLVTLYVLLVISILGIFAVLYALVSPGGSKEEGKSAESESEEASEELGEVKA